jgi:pimeloyl-ACP methyl ester carboxylesterase
MSGGDAALAQALHDAVGTVDPSTVACRIGEVFSVDVSAELQRFSKPLLCIFPTRDRLVPSRAFAKIRALKPSATFVEIEGPHLLLQTDPVGVWQHIRSFVERASDAGCRQASELIRLVPRVP